MTQIMRLTGVQKAAVLMLALGEENCALLFNELHEEEIREISLAMSLLGRISPEVVENTCNEFSAAVLGSGALLGNLDTTENLLRSVLPETKVLQLMEELRGPAGRTMWEKLGNVSDAMLANYLQNEYPQTVAVILGKIRSDQAARVLALFPESFALDVIERMLRAESVPKRSIQRVEETLREEFVANFTASSAPDSYEQLADIFNKMDRKSEGRLMDALSQKSEKQADKIKSRMFTFDDLAALPDDALALILARADRDGIALALKGTTSDLQSVFFRCMSERSARMLRDSMGGLGAVRVRDVETAQSDLVQLAKDMIEDGEIEPLDSGADGEMVL